MSHAPHAHPLRSRAFLATAAALLLLLVVVPFLPDGGQPDAEYAPTSADVRPANTTGYGPVTADLQREIDRVVGEGAAQQPLSAKMAARTPINTLVERSTRCATFEELRYCLGVGWTDSTQAEVQARTALAARADLTRARGNRVVETTGDLGALAQVQRAASQPTTKRVASERAELTQAARSVAKVWLLRHELLGDPLPVGFLDRHPEAKASKGAVLAAAPALPSVSATPSATVAVSPVVATSAAATAAPTTTAAVKTAAEYPARDQVLDESQVAEQQLTYYCGPTTMQMITWGWKQRDKGQAHWATKLGTTRSGTSITAMVSVVNKSTGWDKPEYAGPYVVLDIGKFTYEQWLLLIMRHITDYRAPVIMHPVLRKEFYSYLDDDASGHFQAGRGYRQRVNKPAKVGFFEPWNQQRFDPSEPFIDRVQWRSAYKQYRANLAHFQHNIGV